MKRIIVKDLTDDFISGQGGVYIGKYIDGLIQLNLNEEIEVSMYGIEYVSPSFVNGAFLYLIDIYGEEYFKKYIKIKQVYSSLLPMMRQSISHHIEHRKTFYQKFLSNQIYISIDDTQRSLDILNHIHQEVAQNTKLFWNENQRFDSSAKNRIESCYSFIAVWIETRLQNQDLHIKEIEYALQNGKPCLIFCDKELNFNIPSQYRHNVLTIRFAKQEQFRSTRDVNSFILSTIVRESMPVQANTNLKDNTDNVVATAALVGLGVVGGLLLNELFKK